MRTGLQFYCGKVSFDNTHSYAGDSPLILACSHPNSFFDALVMGAYHPRRLHFLARGDAFKKPAVAKVLRMMNMIPIYRISEGKENLDNNKQTFKECIDILRNNGTVLIFSEGISINEWKMRPLKKGTARLAWMCWEEHGVNDLVIHPTGINYHSFVAAPKRVYVSYAPVINREEFELDNTASFYKQFNQKLTSKLEPLVLAKDDALLKAESNNAFYKMLLAMPALVGWLLHRAPFVMWRKFIRAKTKGTVFFDSVLFASMLILYPIIVLLTTIAAVIITHNPLYWLLFVLVPFTAWSYKQYKSI